MKPWKRKLGWMWVGLVGLMMATSFGVASERTVFPGAEGFGSETPAGRGGKVIKVTTLRPNGPGSLHEAISAKGPRIVVFEVGGVIDLGMSKLRIVEPYLTIAGQTAPEPGITIIRGGIDIYTHDVLIQHIRVRPGDGYPSSRKGWEPDGITTVGKNAYNIVLDHCSVTWAVDENISASGERWLGPEYTSRRVTISHCLIAEGLSWATHSKGEHSKGSLIHDYCQDIAVIKNFYAHNMDRNPYFKAFSTGVIVNNLIYNPGKAAIHVNYVEKEWAGSGKIPANAQISAVGNVMIHGADTKQSLTMIGGRGEVYSEDNVAFFADGKPAPLVANSVYRLQSKPVWPETVHVLPSDKVIDYIVQNAGAWPARRDPVDARIIRDFLERKGRIINSQEEVGGYPNYPETRHTLDVPETGIDRWLEGFTARAEGRANL
ncbi:MAG TPA: right-handed parallel beta-helix repeat-containing protein [Bacillota bacterium]|nr:right-handed parallel beta-helix repeat-containing protein [Bacillota bacterium]HPT87238.1 right-handed parallel beta-helix repeat-containing protein [Bacillota bacterium]